MKKFYRYSLEWMVQTPLHIGAGVTRKGNGIQDAEVALILRDANGNPWIPGSTLKGALRALVTDVTKVERLFAVSHAKGSPLARGTATIGGARFGGGPKAPVFELSQTSVDGGTGVAAASKLYVREFVIEGVTFCSEIELEGCNEVALAKDRHAVEGVMAHAMSAAGLQIGAGKADDLGRVVLTKASCQSATFGETGWSDLIAEPVNIRPVQPTSTDLLSIDFICPGPFISRGKTVDNETHALVDTKGKPRIMGTAVAGALRKRAEWLWAQQTGAPRKKRCATSAGLMALDPVQRLFGYEGRRGLLRISPNNIAVKGMAVIPGVSLNAMAQAPRKSVSSGDKGLLFFYHAHHGVSFRLTLSQRATFDGDEKALFDLLVKDVKDNGMKLGLGTTKGFGWFNCLPAPATGPAPARQPADSYANEPEAMEKLPAEIQEIRKKLQLALPEASVTLPYRMIKADPTLIGSPPEAVQSRVKTHSLLANPIVSQDRDHDGVCGHTRVAASSRIVATCLRSEETS